MTDFAIDETPCKECPLWENSFTGSVRRSQIYGRGTGSSGLYIIGESLTADDIMLGMPFTGGNGNLLISLLKDVGFTEDEVYITNSVRCRTQNAKKPSAVQIKTCTEKHQLLDIPSTPPKLIITLGNIALKAILNLDKITERRGNLYDYEPLKCKVLPTFHPSAILQDPRKYDTVRSDLIKAREYLRDKSEKPPKIHKELINSKESFLRWMALLANPIVKERYCDLETTGLEYTTDEIASMSFTTEMEGEIYSIAFLVLEKEMWWNADLRDVEIFEALQKVLALPIDFHDGLFDIRFLWKLGYQVNYNFDTSDAHLMVDENSPHNMRYLISVYNKFGTLQHKNAFAELGFEEGEFHKGPTHLLLDINIDDTYHGFLLKKKFQDLMVKEKTETVFKKIQMPFKRVLSKMSYRGIMMDRERIKDTSDKYRNNLLAVRDQIWEAAGQKFDYAGSSKDIKPLLFNKLGLPILKRTKKGNPSSDKQALEDLAQYHTVPKLIIEARRIEYALRMFLDGNDLNEKKEIDPNNGMLCKLDENNRIHGRFLSFGTISGRPSCSKPNLLNIPKNSDIRSLFIAPEGWKLIDIDYSQAELVLLAFLSGDPQFMKDVMDTDFHTATAKSIMKMDEIDAEIRRKAKGVNFLKSYGGGKKKLANDLKITEDEADEWLKKWDRTYPLVPLFKNDQKDLWRTQGFIEGIYGRKKRFPPALTEEIESYYDRIAVNFLCQNGVADAINTALIDIDYYLAILFGWTPQKVYQIPGIVLSVYDSIIVECPDNFVPEITEMMKEIMSAPLPKLNISLKMDVDICQRWGTKLVEQEEIDFEEPLEE